jgi:hypothetical protein
LCRTLFDDVDEGERLRQIKETKSKGRPTSPTLPIHQNREGWGTCCDTFGEKQVKYGAEEPHPSHTPKSGRMGHPVQNLRKRLGHPPNPVTGDIELGNLLPLKIVDVI